MGGEDSKETRLYNALSTFSVAVVDSLISQRVNLAITPSSYPIPPLPTLLVLAFVHILSLPQLQNRLRVQHQWLWSYFTGQRSSRLIPEPPTT